MTRARLLLAGCCVVLSLLSCATLSTGTRHTGASRGPQADLLVVLHPMPIVRAIRIAHRLGGSRGLRLETVWEMESLGLPCAVFRVPPGMEMPSLESLERDPHVRYTQPVESYRLLNRDRGDPYAHLQSGLRSIHAFAAQRWTRGRRVRVAVVDTGIDFTHPDLQGAIGAAVSFVPDGAEGFTQDRHGTQLAGVIAARADNRTGIRGVAPEATLLALKACAPTPAGGSACDSYTLALALDDAITRGAHVLNLSLAGPRDRLLTALIGKALEHEIVIVVASESGPGEALSFPASVAGVLPVVTANDSLRSAHRDETKLGPAKALTAPGHQILTTVPGGRYDFASGASLAAAHVTGIVAMLLEIAPDLTPDRVAELLQPRSLVDACRAVVSLRGEGQCPSENEER